MEETIVCGINYYSEMQGHRCFKCQLAPEHEGTHDDGEGHRSYPRDYFKETDIDRDIKQSLKERAREK